MVVKKKMVSKRYSKADVPEDAVRAIEWKLRYRAVRLSRLF